GAVCFDLALYLSGINCRFYYFSPRFDFGDNHKAKLGFHQFMAFAYHGNCDPADGYNSTPRKYKTTIKRYRKSGASIKKSQQRKRKNIER
ncbi:MAG: hypothetical protein PVJ60_08040, partial [Phycisphaerales bacterium]